MDNSRQPQAEPNPNMRWSRILVQALAAGGLGDVCLSPGSRSTPLALAFAENEQIKVHVHMDERSASFFALGMALGGNRPVALLCTSGTAAANYYPAIVEARMSQVPLLILTADRPHELRHSGANQTIDQTKLYGDQVLWSVDLPLPQDNPPPLVLRNMRSLAARALARADGIPRGPVHLNFPFRKPLEPRHGAAGRQHLQDASPPFIERGVLHPSTEQVGRVLQHIADNERGLIVCGPRCPGNGFAAAASLLARRAAYPILADALSGVRYGRHISQTPVCGAYDTFLRPPVQLPEPQLILHFGALPTSQRLNDYLARAESAVRIQINEDGVWRDDSHRTTHLIQADPTRLCEALAGALPDDRRSRWLEVWIQSEAQAWTALENQLQGSEFDAAYVADLVQWLPADNTLFVGNSLPVRHVDQFAQPQQKKIAIFANRGASGIDGNISTGLGLAAQGLLPLTILVGDITFLHDSNGLLALRQLNGSEITLVVLNNNGGGIFRRLPVSRFQPQFDELFRVPHDLDFAPYAALHTLEFFRPLSRSEFRAALDAPRQSQMARLIEIGTDPETDFRCWSSLRT